MVTILHLFLLISLRDMNKDANGKSNYCFNVF